MVATRTMRHIAHAESDDLFICRQVAGDLALEQECREVRLEAGDVTLIDPLLPYVARFSRNSRLLVLKIKRPALEARVGKTRDLVAHPLRPHDAPESLLSSFLMMLPLHSDGMPKAVSHVVESQTLDLLAATLASIAGRGLPRVSSARSLLLTRLRAAIEAKLGDPTLTPVTVAADVGISVRYANLILAEEGMSITRLVLARRLARCRSALTDPLQQHRTLSEIAYGWGFCDMTHFSRSFRKAYGMSPSECRRTAECDQITDMA